MGFLFQPVVVVATAIAVIFGVVDHTKKRRNKRRVPSCTGLRHDEVGAASTCLQAVWDTSLFRMS
jgi:hypothetical protein